MEEYSALPISGYVRASTILKIIPVGATTWWNGVKSGRFPKSVKLGPMTTAWKVEDIRELMKKYERGENV